MTGVYFIRIGEDGPVKIGWTIDPARRTAELQVACHDTLHLIRTVPGCRAMEAAFHRRFADRRLRGEWFVFTPEMLTECVTAETPDRAAADDGFPNDEEMAESISNRRDLLTPPQIEWLALRAGISIGAMCRRAGVAKSTFWRWKQGKLNPTIDVYRRLRDAVTEEADGTRTQERQ